MTDKYLSLGVSASKSDVHAAVSHQDSGAFPGAFCKLVADAASPDYVSAFHADGAGTKSSLAYIKYKLTGDTSAFSDIAVDSVVMNLDDLLCVGAVGPFYMSNTIGRNAHLVGGDGVAAIIGGYERFTEKLRGYGVNVVMCGGETADVGDLVRTVIVDSTFFTRMPKADVVDASKIKAGSVIVGLASSGKAIYEEKYNAGMGSNGLTAARHMLLSRKYAELYPESYSPTVAEPYTGSFDFFDKLEGTDICVGDGILSPTRTFAPVIAAVLSEYRPNVTAIIHNTGGAHTKCRGFGHGVRYVKDSMIMPPPLFKTLAATGAMTQKELFTVFNMGCRMELYTDGNTAAKIIGIAASFGVDAQIIGHTESAKSDANELVITSPLTGETIVY